MSSNNSQPDYGKKLASWEFQEPSYGKKSTLWYLIAGIIVLALIVYSILSANFLFTFIIFISAVIYLFASFKAPEKINFSIYEDGLIVNSLFYPFEELKDFWIAYKPPEVKLIYFTQKSVLHGELVIYLDKENPVKIREILLEHLKENQENDDESLTDTIRRSVGL